MAYIASTFRALTGTKGFFSGIIAAINEGWTKGWHLPFPPNCAAIEARPSGENYSKRQYIVGGFSTNILIDEDLRVLNQGISIPPMPSVSVGAGTNAQICYLRFYDELTGERSPLSSGKSVTGDLNRVWSSLPTSVPGEGIVISGTVNISGGTVTGTNTNFHQLRPGDRIADVGDLTIWAQVRSIASDTSMTIDNTSMSKSGVRIAVKPVSRVSHVEQWVSVFGSLPRFAFRVRLGTTSVSESTPTLSLGEAYIDTYVPMPIGSMNVIYNTRQIVSGVVGRENEIIVSQIGYPERYGGLSFVTKYSEPVVGLVCMRDYVIVLCPKSSYRLQGFTDTDFNLTVLEPNIGGLGHKGNVVAGGMAFIPSREQIQVFDGAFHPAIPTRKTEWARNAKTYEDAFRSGIGMVNPDDQTYRFLPFPGRLVGAGFEEETIVSAPGGEYLCAGMVEGFDAAEVEAPRLILAQSEAYGEWMYHLAVAPYCSGTDDTYPSTRPYSRWSFIYRIGSKYKLYRWKKVGASYVQDLTDPCTGELAAFLPGEAVRWYRSAIPDVTGQVVSMCADGDTLWLGVNRKQKVEASYPYYSADTNFSLYKWVRGSQPVLIDESDGWTGFPYLVGSQLGTSMVKWGDRVYFSYGSLISYKEGDSGFTVPVPLKTAVKSAGGSIEYEGGTQDTLFASIGNWLWVLQNGAMSELDLFRIDSSHTIVLTEGWPRVDFASPVYYTTVQNGSGAPPNDVLLQTNYTRTGIHESNPSPGLFRFATSYGDGIYTADRFGLYKLILNYDPPFAGPYPDNPRLLLTIVRGFQLYRQAGWHRDDDSYIERIEDAVSFDGYLYYFYWRREMPPAFESLTYWQNWEPAQYYIGRYDGVTWDDTFKNLSAQFPELGKNERAPKTKQTGAPPYWVAEDESGTYDTLTVGREVCEFGPYGFTVADDRLIICFRGDDDDTQCAWYFYSSPGNDVGGAWTKHLESLHHRMWHKAVWW